MTIQNMMSAMSNLIYIDAEEVYCVKCIHRIFNHKKKLIDKHTSSIDCKFGHKTINKDRLSVRAELVCGFCASYVEESYE